MSDVKEQKIRVFEIVDQQNSNYILEGTENTDPVRLTSAALHRVPNRSVMVIKRDGRKIFEPIRYIRGCHSISVREQDEMGFKPNQQVGADELFFENGKLILVDDGEMATICNYFDHCAFNVSNENRREDATPIIRELKKAEEAQVSIDDFFTRTRATDYLKELVLKSGSGKKATIKYKEEKIDYLCSLFQIVGLSDYGEKFHALINFASAQPNKFLESVANVAATTEVDVLQAIEYGVISFQDDKVVFSDGNKVITTVKSSGKKREKELVEYFLSTEAEVNYKQLIIALRYQKGKRLGNIKEGEGLLDEVTEQK